MLSYADKTRLVDYHIASRRTRLTTFEGYDFAFAPEGQPPPTAYWRYDKHRRRHNIVFGSTVDDPLNRPSALSSYRSKITFLERVYDHEGGHSLFTERDNDKLGELCKKYKVPFILLNLFEDSRIEASWRRKFIRRFHWLRYSLLMDEQPPPAIPDPPGTPMSAVGLFLDCILIENSPKLLSEWVGKDKDPKIQYESKGKPRYGRRHLIRWYYRRAARSHSTVSLFPIIASWIKTFPETAKSDCIGVGGLDMPSESGTGEMPAYVVDPDGSAHAEIKETTAHKSGTGGGTMDSKIGTIAIPEKEEDYRYKGESRSVRIPHSEFFDTKRRRKMDYHRADALIRLFEKFLTGGEGLISSRNPTGRIDMRKFLRGAEDIYLRKGDDPYGVKDISFILDCSGSMSRAIEDGVYLAYVLNELTRHRKIQCRKMILCGGSNQAIPMPFDPEILNYLQTPGSIEGFVKAMREHEKELVSTDLTIFFTDGNITDEHIVKEDWHRKGVYSIGLFVGDPSRSATLHQWFDSVLVRNDIEMVADSLVQLIKR